MLAGLGPSGGSRENCSLLPPVPGSSHHPVASDRITLISAIVITLPSLLPKSNISLPASHMDSWITLGQISTAAVTSLLPHKVCHVTQSQVPGIRTWISLGAIIQPNAGCMISTWFISSEVTSITWVRWCLPGFSTIMLLFEEKASFLITRNITVLTMQVMMLTLCNDHLTPLILSATTCQTQFQALETQKLTTILKELIASLRNHFKECQFINTNKLSFSTIWTLLQKQSLIVQTFGSCENGN